MKITAMILCTVIIYVGIHIGVERFEICDNLVTN